MLLPWGKPWKYWAGFKEIWQSAFPGRERDGAPGERNVDSIRDRKGPRLAAARASHSGPPPQAASTLRDSKRSALSGQGHQQGAQEAR
jgi:hypothetical protein